MGTKHANIIIVLLTVILGIQIYTTFLVAPAPIIPPKWEYGIEWFEDKDFETSVNNAGQEGWEMVFARRATNTNDKYGYEMIFRRQILSSSKNARSQ